MAPEHAERIRYAASLTGASVSAFVVDAATEKADRILAEQRETIVESDFFDRLLAALDEPVSEIAPLARAGRRARKAVVRR